MVNVILWYNNVFLAYNKIQEKNANFNLNFKDFC